MKYTSLSVRVWVEWMDILKKAVKSLNAKRGKDEEPLTIPEYVRSRLGPIMAKDAGVPLPEFPAFSRGRPSAARQVADRLGVPVEQWRKQVTEDAARMALERWGSGAPAPASSKRKNA